MRALPVLIGLGAVGALLALSQSSASAAEPAESEPSGAPPPPPPRPPPPRAPAPAPSPPAASPPVVVQPPPFPILTPSGPVVIPPPPFPVPVPVTSGKPVPAAPSGLPLRQGSSGTLVREVQARLNAAIGAGLAVDGKYGPATVGAVRRYQGSHKDLAGNPLAVDGVVGAKTYGSLLAATPRVTLPSVLSADELEALGADDCLGCELAALCGAMLRAVHESAPGSGELVREFQEAVGLVPSGVYDVPTARKAGRLGFVPAAPHAFTGKKQLRAWRRAVHQQREVDPQRADEWLWALPQGKAVRGVPAAADTEGEER